jgi:8-oxo-dGTP diphosphatase
MNYTGPSSKPHDSGVAVAIFVERDGKYLLMKREGSVGAGTWAVPGGGVNFMEDPIEAAARELEEETGIKNPELHFIGYSNDTHYDNNLHYVTFLYKVTRFEGEPNIKEPHKCSEIGWYPLEKLPTPLFSALQRKLKDPSIIRTLHETK